jgi:hypothetical protein
VAELWLLRGTIVLSSIYALIYIGIWIYHFSGINDFFVFWSAARWLVERGFSPQIYDFEIFRAFQADLTGELFAKFHPFAYPPSVLILIAPLGVVSQLPAMATFLVTTLTLYLAALSLDCRRTWIAVLASPAVLLNVVIGQNGFLSGALLIGGLSLSTRHPVVAGACIGLLTFKPHIGILAPFVLIAARQWTTLLAATLSAGLLFLVSFAIGGADLWLAWLDLMPKFAETTASNIDSALRFMISPTATLVILGIDYHTARLLQIPITVAVIVVVWRVCRDRGLTPMTIAAICAGTLLAAPFGYFYDLTIPTAATVLLAQEAMRRGTRSGEIFIVLLAWTSPLISLSHLSIPGLVPVVLALLFLAILRRIYGDQRDDSIARSPVSEGTVTAR